jgi:hypothetical protein
LYVRKTQIATIASQQTTSLFDHFVGGGEWRRRDAEAECFGGVEVDYQVEFRSCNTGNEAGFAPAKILPA